MKNKKCVKCNQDKSLRSYYKKGNTYFLQCKECIPEYDELIRKPSLIYDIHSIENIYYNEDNLIEFLNNGTTKWNYIQRITSRDTISRNFNDTDEEELRELLVCVNTSSYSNIVNKGETPEESVVEEGTIANENVTEYIPDGKLHYDIAGKTIYLPDGEKITLNRELINKWSIQFESDNENDYLDLEYRKLRMIEDVGVNTNTDEESIEKIVTLEKIYANAVLESNKTKDYRSMKELSEMINKLRSASGFSGKDINDKATNVTADSLGSYIDSIENDKLIMEHLNPINKEQMGFEDDVIDILLTDYLRNSIGLDGLVKKEDSLVWNELNFTKLNEETKYVTATKIMEKLKEKHEEGEIR